MSGQSMHIYNNITRRTFIKKSVAGISALTILPSLINTSCSSKNKITGSIINDNSKAGHLIRDGFKGSPTNTIDVPLCIIGAGISGLSAGYHLKKQGITNFLIFDLETKHGGNSISDSNAITSYPWAAHYLPIVNNTNQDLLDFLHAHHVITDFDNEGLPIYNEYYLCFDPEERLFINGQWQDGLIPSFGVPENEKKEISDFFKLIKSYKNKIGDDGKSVFEIPICNSSKDEESRKLDLISFSDFLKENNYTSPYLLWYLNYCCKDDYGSTLLDTSAYAGLHYFCARRAQASNADSSAVLTWPEGNSFLANKLYDSCKENVKTKHLTTSITIVNNMVEVIAFHTETKECIKYRCHHAIIATPQYINNYLLSDALKLNRKQKELFEYSPWMVANITVTNLPEYKGEPLSWDNVMYHSKSLGYVNACHQKLNKDQEGLLFTYYLPLVDNPCKEARKQAREKTHQEWVSEIVADLKQAHQNIENYITNIDVKIWGHGMIKPKPNFIFNSEKENYVKSIDDKLFFAHTDLAGISIFEEAFSQGIQATKQIMTVYDKHSKA